MPLVRTMSARLVGLSIICGLWLVSGSAHAQIGPEITRAIEAHRRAQRLRRRATEQRSERLLARARAAYAEAAEGYRAILGADPTEHACELRYDLADALYWSGRYEEAEPQYARVRDACPEFVSEAGRRVVESVHRQLEAAGVEIPDAAPEPRGAPPRVAEIAWPPRVRRLVAARDAYLARVDDATDREGVRDAYAYNNAIAFYLYGRWPEARRRLRRIFRARCPSGHEVAIAAWETLYQMAVALDDEDEVSRLSRQLSDRPCPQAADHTGCVGCGVQPVGP